MVLNGERRCMGQTARFQEILRRLAMIDEVFVEDDAALGLGQVASAPWIPRLWRCYG